MRGEELAVLRRMGYYWILLDGSLMKLERILCLWLRGVFFSRTSEQQEGILSILQVAKHQFRFFSGMELESLQTLFMKPA